MLKKNVLKAVAGKGICVRDLKAAVNVFILFNFCVCELIVLSVWAQNEKWPLLLSDRTDKLRSAAIKNNLILWKSKNH